MTKYSLPFFIHFVLKLVDVTQPYGLNKGYDVVKLNSCANSLSFSHLMIG